MNKFIKKVGTALLIIIFIYVALAIVGIFIIGNQYDMGFPGCLQDKVARVNSIDEPKIVLVGDSSVAFGFRSDILEEAMGMPVVNMGVQHDLGLEFDLRLGEINVGPGDIVIIATSEYSEDISVISPQLLWTYLEWNRDLWSLVRAKDIPVLIKAFPAYMVDAIKSAILGSNAESGTAYSRSAFNEYGDNVFANSDTEHYVELFNGGVVDIGDASVDYVNEMNKRVTEKGAVLLIAQHPICWVEADSDPDFSEYNNSIREKFDCPCISNANDYVYPESYFYDTFLHLNGEGARIRTEQLVKDLKAYLGE